MDSEQFLREIHGKNVNFLIGSGTSAGVVPTLWSQTFEKSFEDILTDSTYSDEQRKVLYYIWFELWIRKTQITTYDKQNDIHKHYLEFLQSLTTFLNNEGYDHPKRINLFTTNYDTLFEVTFDELARKNRLVFFNDGSRGFFNRYISTENFYINASHSATNDQFVRQIPSINLLKMHGSVTWSKESKESSEIKASAKNTVFDKVCKAADELKESINGYSGDVQPERFQEVILDEAKDSLTADNFNEFLDYVVQNCSGELDNFYNVYCQLPVVNPTKEKFADTVFQQTYYQMLRMLSFELEKDNSVLVVFGFSFADEHIREIVRRSMMNPHLKLYIICYSKEAELSIRSYLGDDAPSQHSWAEYIPSSTERKTLDGHEITGNFEYLNSLFQQEN